MGACSLSKELIPAGKQMFGMSEAEVREKAMEFGPIPRQVLQQGRDVNSRELESAINGCGLEDLLSCLLGSTIALPEVQRDRLLVVRVKKDYSEGEVSIASPRIEAELAAKMERQSFKQAEIFARRLGGNPAIQSFRARIQARADAHAALQRGGRFWCRDLDTQAEFWVGLPFCSRSEEVQDDGDLASLQPGKYGKVVSEYALGGVDAVVQPGRIYQITASERHKIEVSAVATVVAEMGCFGELELFWAVDQQTFNLDFRKQAFRQTEGVTAAEAQEARRIKQYLLQLPDHIQLMAEKRDTDANPDSDTEDSCYSE